MPNLSEESKPALSVGIDGNEANVAMRVGSNVYAFEILHQLELITRGKSEYRFVIFLSSEPVGDMPFERPGWEYKKLSPAKFATQWALPLALFKLKSELDLFFTPGHYAPRMCPIPYITSVMDLAFLHYPKQFKLRDLIQLKNWTKYSVQHANAVVTISQFSKQEISKNYKVPTKNIKVIYPGSKVIPKLRLNNQEVEDTLSKLKVKRPYILYVGTLQPRKNLNTLIEAYEKLCLKQDSEVTTVEKKVRGKKRKATPTKNHLQLVLAGKVGWLANPILKRIEISPFKSSIHLTGFVSDSEKELLYRQAECSVLVGLYEGFGIPALESLQYGVVPVVSKTSSLPEVVGEAGILVNPENATSIMRGIESAITMNSSKRKKFIAQAKQQTALFSWEESAQKLLHLFERFKAK